MKKKNWIFGLLISGSLWSFYGCGTQDYEENQVSSPSKKEETPSPTQGKIGWKEFAPSKRSASAVLSISRANEKEQELFTAGATHDDRCPENTICLRAPYFGEEQLGLLVKDYPTLFSIQAHDRGAAYVFQSTFKLRIESDLVHLSDGFALKSCAPETDIVASEVEGEGEIITSIEGCIRASSRKNAGDLFIGATSAQGLKIQANGGDGKNGTSGTSTWSGPVESGNPKALSIQIETTKISPRICLESFSCTMAKVRERGVPQNATVDQGFDGMADDEKTANRNLNYLVFLGLPISEIQKHLEQAKQVSDAILATPYKRGENPFKNPRPVPMGCYLVSDPSQTGQTGLITKFVPTVKGAEGLNGKDANSQAAGENGEDGGDSGHIEVFAEAIKIPTIEAKAGKSGQASSSVAQEPGKGVAPAEKSKSFSYTFLGYITCEQVNENNQPVDTYYHRKLEVEVKRTFTLGESYQAEFSEEKHPIFGEELRQSDGEIRGRDGKALPIQETRAGREGEVREPSVIRIPVKELLISKIKEKCPECEIPKTLQ